MMKRRNVIGLVGGTALIGLAVTGGFAGQAQASLVSCPSSFTANGTAKVHDGSNSTAASLCQYDDATNQSDVANISNINTSGFFGFSDWMTNGQDQINSNQSSGTWSIDNVDFDDFDYIIVYKNGNGTHLTAFLFNEDYSSGSWSTPFTDPPFNLPGNSTSHDVSHYTIAKRAAGNGVIPEPASLAIFGISLLGLSWAVRRRANATA